MAVPISPRELKPWERIPTTWPGSAPEYAIYWAHDKLGLKEGINFFYQSPFAGGRLFIGGAVIDFMEIDVNVAIRVQGLYFHAYAGGDRRALDHLQRIAIESQGITVVDITDEDALESPIPVLRDARSGIERPQPGRE